MLARYKLYRGKRPAGDPLPGGIRKDTRHRTDHCLRPTEAIVRTFLEEPSEERWEAFALQYRHILTARFAEDRRPFDEIARLAREGDVHIGCSCPTAKNPDVSRCHTVLALEFLRERYPDLVVVFPSRDASPDP